MPQSSSHSPSFPSSCPKGAKIYLRHGGPRLRPFSLSALQHYLTVIVPTNDFHFLVVGACFFGHAVPITLCMAPLVSPQV